FEQKQYSRSAGFFEEASQSLSQDPKVWNNLGCAYFQQKNYGPAYQAFKTSVAKGASFYHAYYNMAVASILSGNYEEAVEDTNQAVQLAPDNPDAYNLLGLSFLFNDNYLRASVNLARAIQLDSSNSGYYNNLGRAQLGLGHYRDAEKMLQKALLYEPGLKPALWNMGDLKLRQGKYPESLNFYENVTDWEPADQSAVFQYNLGVAYYKTGDKDNAAKVWEKARGLDPQYLEPLYGLAILSEDEKNYDNAQSLLRQGQVAEPQSSRWVRLEGDLDMAQGKTKEALEAYEKAQEMGQKDAELFAHIQQLKNASPAQNAPASESPEPAASSSVQGYQGQIEEAENRGNLDEALALAKEASHHWSEDPQVWESLSNVNLKLDKKLEALDAMERALRLSPRDGHYLEECGHLAYLNDKLELSRHYFEQALAAPSSTWQTTLGLGDCSYRQNLFDEAIAYWEKGSAAYPYQPEFYYNLGRAHYQKGENAQAALYFKKALQLRPRYPEVITNMAAMDLDV
ncbi:MAG TPA: tetratricopeptide repeat protein, partial [bacterium]|nr:tetratricopeptide repeat protein [bacterium]